MTTPLDLWTVEDLPTKDALDRNRERYEAITRDIESGIETAKREGVIKKEIEEEAKVFGLAGMDPSRLWRYRWIVMSLQAHRFRQGHRDFLAHVIDRQAREIGGDL